MENSIDGVHVCSDLENTGCGNHDWLCIENECEFCGSPMIFHPKGSDIYEQVYQSDLAEADHRLSEIEYDL